MDKDLKKKLAESQSLPTIPAVAERIVRLLKDDDFGLEDMVKIVAGDPAISTKLVSRANSAAYTRGEACATIGEAVMRLGLSGTVITSLSFSLMDTMRGAASGRLDYELFWRRSLLAAATARFLAHVSGLRTFEEAFLAGLLQDMGMMVLDRAIEDAYSGLDHQSTGHANVALYETERFGCDHAEIGQWLLGEWGFPAGTINAIGRSHHVEDLTLGCDRPNLEWCLAYSGVLADALIADSPEPLRRALSFGHSFLNGTANWEDEFSDAMILAIKEVEQNFEISLTSDLFRLLDESKALLMTRLGDTPPADNLRLSALESRVVILEEENKMDKLTGVFNRHYFDTVVSEHVLQARVEGTPTSLVFVDADHFKQINDTYGHPVGDQVLRWLAGMLKNMVRDGDIVARYGGEEFVVILPALPEPAAVGLGQRIVEAFRHQNFVTDDHDIPVRLSIGTATVSTDSPLKTAQQLVQAADQAMYVAKLAGRDSCVSAASISNAMAATPSGDYAKSAQMGQH